MPCPVCIGKITFRSGRPLIPSSAYVQGDRRLRAEFAIRWRQIKRHFEHRIAAQGIGVDPVLVAGADHQEPKANDVRQAVGDLLRRPRINQARGEPIGDLELLFDLAQRQNATVRRKHPPSNLTTTDLPETDDKPGSGSIGSFMAGVAQLKSRESPSTTIFYAKPVA